MPRNFSPAGLPAIWKEPRVVFRAIMGALLAANLAAAVIAFHPFGGSAEDLRHQEGLLNQQLQALRKRVATDKGLVAKMQSARKDTDEFLAKYVTDARFGASTLETELIRIATEAGVKQLPTTINPQDIEGSEGMQMMTVTAGYEGTYANLAKFINLVDKSPRFLIIENLATGAPQQNGAPLNVQIKIDTFQNHAEETR
jgi:Tfp pilus assembly protein PilO